MSQLRCKSLRSSEHSSAIRGASALKAAESTCILTYLNSLKVKHLDPDLDNLYHRAQARLCLHTMILMDLGNAESAAWEITGPTAIRIFGIVSPSQFAPLDRWITILLRSWLLTKRCLRIYIYIKN